ncbi:hypothetical protein [Marivirga harenae]|uniref:hypothetical protein n=1 Tax=Marivirga harenae TaxID=2010992 RepID=UPI0026E0D141|nr:hypothetical protein [Marivirga harenae]WKV12185.1 hypothetical protein Q3Y49_18470 [Marivirga harenae]WKV12200.1 hypothetical protein Q3Y49_18545 [Marivirga harenae]
MLRYDKVLINYRRLHHRISRGESLSPDHQRYYDGASKLLSGIIKHGNLNSGNGLDTNNKKL